MSNKRTKLVVTDSDGNKDQVFPETDQYSVIGLLKVLSEVDTRLTSLETSVTKLKNKTGVK